MGLCTIKHTWLFMGLCPKPRPPAFLSEKSGAKELNFSCFTLSFRAGVYGTKMGMVSRKMKLVIFTCLSAKLQRRFAARENWSGSRRGNPYDNAMAENFFSILKTECIYRVKLKTYDEAKKL